MKQITLEVQGMSCGHCVISIEDSVGNLSGVKFVKVHLDTNKVEIEFSSNIVSLEEVKNEIEEQMNQQLSFQAKIPTIYREPSEYRVLDAIFYWED